MAAALRLLPLLALVCACPSVTRAEEPAAAEEEVIEEIVEVAEIEDISTLSPFSASAWRTPEAFPRIERAVNLLSARTVRKNSLLLVIDHRASAPVDENTWRDFFGLDAGGLKIGLGVRYGILDDLDAGISRLNGTLEAFDTCQFDLRWRFLPEERLFVDAAVRAGIDWFYQPGAADGFGWFGELLLGRSLFDRLRLGLAAIYHTDSSGPVKRPSDADWSFAVGGSLDLRLASFWAVTGEVVGPVAGYRASWPGWSGAMRFITSRHTFSLVCSNTQYILSDGLAAGSPRGAGGIIVGFAITREINF